MEVCVFGGEGTISLGGLLIGGELGGLPMDEKGQQLKKKYILHAHTETTPPPTQD